MASAEVSHPLLVDLYELTMVDAYRRSGMADRMATFSVFVRDLPADRGYLVAAGLDDVLTWLERLRFGAAELAVIERLGLFDRPFLDWLATVRFTGRVRAVPEGTIVFGGEPILEVDAPIAQGQLAETFALNQVTLQTMLATSAARCRHAAGGRPVVDFGLRRSAGIDAGMKLARVGRIVALAGTSNLAGADRYGLPASGTMAHAIVQAHEDETEAFRTFARAHGDRTVLLVDTYDTLRGVDRAITVAREQRAAGRAIRGIRLDSGDLGGLAVEARRRLDAAGMHAVQVIATGGLDEHVIAELVAAGAPIDGFGVGSALGVSNGGAGIDTVYKLVAYDGRPVQKSSTGKAIWPDAKQVWRRGDWSGDVIARAGEQSPGPGHRPLLVEVMRDGVRTRAGTATLDDANGCFEAGWAGLPTACKELVGPVPHPVVRSAALVELRAELRELERRSGNGVRR